MAARIAVIDKSNPGTDKNIILQSHPVKNSHPILQSHMIANDSPFFNITTVTNITMLAYDGPFQDIGIGPYTGAFTNLCALGCTKARSCLKKLIISPAHHDD
jgi:hypothetical protein